MNQSIMTFKVNPYDADYTEHMPWMLNFQKIEEIPIFLYMFSF